MQRKMHSVATMLSMLRHAAAEHNMCAEQTSPLTPSPDECTLSSAGERCGCWTLTMNRVTFGPRVGQGGDGRRARG
jgi:hypothetical protein